MPRRREITLTKLQQETMVFVGAGLTDKNIADYQGVSTKAVSARISRVMQKVGAANRTEAVVDCLKRGEIEQVRIDWVRENLL